MSEHDPDCICPKCEKKRDREERGEKALLFAVLFAACTGFFTAVDYVFKWLDALLWHSAK